MACPFVAGGCAAQAPAVGDLQLQAHEVEPGRALGDRMLDLQSGVHLEEEEASGFVRQELDGARTFVADRAGRRDRRLEQPLAHAGRPLDQWRRRLLDHLLVPPLDRALALADRPHGAVLVGHDLHLDVPAGLQVRLAEDGRVAERGCRLGARTVELLREFVE